MRHLSQKVGLLTDLMVGPSQGGLLVTARGPAKRIQPGLGRALGAVDVSPVATGADLHLLVAEVAMIESVGLGDPRPPSPRRQKAFFERRSSWDRRFAWLRYP